MIIKGLNVTGFYIYYYKHTQPEAQSSITQTKIDHSHRSVILQYKDKTGTHESGVHQDNEWQRSVFSPSPIKTELVTCLTRMHGQHILALQIEAFSSQKQHCRM